MNTETIIIVGAVLFLLYLTFAKKEKLENVDTTRNVVADEIAKMFKQNPNGTYADFMIAARANNNPYKKLELESTFNTLKALGDKIIAIDVYPFLEL